MIHTAPVIFVVDDDADVRRALERLLRSAGFRVKTFARAEEFLESGDFHRSGVLVLDVRLPGMSGLELQASLRNQGVTMPIVFITAFDDEGGKAQGLAGGAMAYLSKTCSEQILLGSIEGALQKALEVTGGA